MSLGEEYHGGEMPFLSHHIRQYMIVHDLYGDVDLDHLVREMSAEFLHSQVLTFPFVCSVFFGSKTRGQRTIMEEGIKLHFFLRKTCIHVSLYIIMVLWGYMSLETKIVHQLYNVNCHITLCLWMKASCPW